MEESSHLRTDDSDTTILSLSTISSVLRLLLLKRFHNQRHIDEQEVEGFLKPRLYSRI
jgi:hypothetical protein